MSEYEWSDGPDIDDWGADEYEALLPSREDLFEPLEFEEEDESPVDRERTRQARPKVNDVTWFYDTSGYYAYVLMDGERREHEQVVDALREAEGISVLTTGYAHRPASSGAKYEWYIRVATTGSSNSHPDLTEVRKTIDQIAGRDAFDGDSTYAPAPSFPNNRSNDRRKLGRPERPPVPRKHSVDDSERPGFWSSNEELSGRLAELQTRYDDLEKEHKRLEDAYYRLELNYGKIRDRIFENEQDYQAQTKLVQQYVDALKADLAKKDREKNHSAEHTQTLQKQIAALQESLQKREEQQRLNGQYLEELAEENGKLKDDLEVERTQREELLARLAKVETLQPQRLESNDFYRVLELFPDVKYINGSLDVLFTEFGDPWPTISTIAELSRQGRLKHAKGVTSLNGWFEAHLKTGSNIAGRIYYATRGGNTYVLIGDKRSQKLDVRRLRKAKALD